MSADTLKTAAAAVEGKPTSPTVDLLSPQSKRMKQGCLAFKPLTQKALSPVQNMTKECKKRKLSDPDTPTAKQPKSVKPQTQNKTLARPENDNEVSSSSEADLHGSVSMPKPVSRKTLERFVSSFVKEEDITSTNDVIDLTESSSHDNDEPMELDCNKENESEIIVLDKATTSANFIDNVAKIVDSVASGKFEPKESKPSSPCNKKPEKTHSPPGLKNIRGWLLKTGVKGKPVKNSEICDKNNLQTDNETTCSLVNTEATKSAANTLSPACTYDETDTKKNHIVSSKETPNSSKQMTASSVDSSEKVNDIDASHNDTKCLESENPVTESNPTTCSSNLQSVEIEEMEDSHGAEGSDCQDSSFDDSVLELSSSAISPQTADDSFKRVTSAGSTPRTSKPRSKVSSAKKAEREALRQKRKEQKEKELEEKKRIKEEAKAEKERLRKEEKDRKEKERAQKEQERLDKREQMEKEKSERLQQKEEERKKKQEVLEAKLEEKRKKEEEKRIIEEEKRLKEEEKQKEEDEKLNKKKKMQDKFQSFFTKSKASPPAQKMDTEQTVGRFMPFEVKKDMKLAPQNFCQISDESKNVLDQLLLSQDSPSLYLDQQKNGIRKPKSWSKDKDGGDVEDVTEPEHDSEVVKKVTYHVKLLQFHLNHRPPYYGTWRKRSKVISPRNPWKTDSGSLDYEVDSDDEWEEEEPGESLSASEGEDEKDGDKEGDEDEEEEDGWLVPHGYLSEDEGCVEDEEVTPEMLKARQTAKLVQWEREQQRQCQPQRAIVSGCFWVASDRPEPQDSHQMLAQFKAVLFIDGDQCVPTTYTRVEKSRTEAGSMQDGLDKLGDTPSSKGQLKRPVPEEAMPDLIRLVHGNPSGIKRLVEEFRVYWARKSSQPSSGDVSKAEGKEEAMAVDEPQLSTDVPSINVSLLNSEADGTGTPSKVDEDKDECTISKRQTEIRITAIAIREKRSLCKKNCWYVHDSILQQYNLTQLPVPCEWQYLTIPNRRETAENLNTSGRKTPNTKMFALGSPAASSSPSDLKEKVEAPKRPSDQRSIMFFTKAKDAILKTKPADTTVKVADVHTVPPSAKPADTTVTVADVHTVLPSAKPADTTVTVADVHTVPPSAKELSAQLEPEQKIVPSGNIVKPFQTVKRIVPTPVNTQNLPVPNSQVDFAIKANPAVLSTVSDEIKTLNPEIICLD